MEAWSVALTLSLLVLQYPYSASAVAGISVGVTTATVVLGIIAGVYLLLSIVLAIIIIAILCGGKQEKAYKPNETPPVKKTEPVKLRDRGGRKKPSKSSRGNKYQVSQEQGAMALTTFRKISNDLNGTRQHPIHGSSRRQHGPDLNTQHSSVVSLNRTTYEDTLRTSTFITAEFYGGVPQEGAFFENRLFEAGAPKSHSSSSSQPSDDVFVDTEDKPSPLPTRDEIKGGAQARRHRVERTSSTKPLLTSSESEDLPSPSPVEDTVQRHFKVGRTPSTKPLLHPSESDDVPTPSPMEDEPLSLHTHLPSSCYTSTEDHAHYHPSHNIERERPHPSPAYRRVSPVPVGVPIPPPPTSKPAHELTRSEGSEMDLLDGVLADLEQHGATQTDEVDVPMPRERLATDV